MQLRSTKKIVPCVLFVFCSLAALFTAGAVEKSPLPEVVHLEHNGAFYKIDYSDFTRNRLSRALDGGCYEVSLSRRSEGKSWKELLIRTICLDDWGVTIRDAAGPDIFEVGIPKAALLSNVSDIPTDVMATVSVNGHIEELDQTLLYQLAIGVAGGTLPAGVEDRVEFANLAWHYSEGGWYHQALPLFQTLQEVVADRYLIPELDGSVPMGCWQPCLTCGTAALGTLFGGTVLAATCATTFGATCIGGAVGVVRLAVATVVSCEDCRVCRSEPECSTGYSPCCENLCCQDGIPLPDCAPAIP